MLKKYPDYQTEVMVAIDDDPSGNNKYLAWIMGQYERLMQNQHNNTDIMDVVGVVKKFHNNIQRIKNKDINSYEKLSDLEDVVEKVESSMTKTQIKKGATKIDEDERWLIIRPDTKEASCVYGSSTKWCTTMEDREHYEDYTDMGNLYYIIDKSKELGRFSKIALFKRWNGEEEWYDSTDEQLSTTMEDLVVSMLPNESYNKVITNWKLGERQGNKEKEDNRITNGNDMRRYFIDQCATPRLPISIKTKMGTWTIAKPFDQQITFHENFSNDTLGNNSSFYIVANPFSMDDVMTVDISYDSDKDWTEFDRFTFIHNSQEVFGQSFDSLMEKANGGHHDSWFFSKYVNFMKGSINTGSVATWMMSGFPELSVKSTWSANHPDTSYRFENPKSANLANAFTDFIKMMGEKGEKATRKDFLIHIGKPTSPGYFSAFFGAIKQSGIVDIKRDGRSFYYELGPNYDDFTKGNLHRLNQ
tara:strand:- start:1071 stop:2489 length:1419 start_codon:yes stop_codon:yes gene_type:complete